jgi:FkbH-like protein
MTESPHSSSNLRNELHEAIGRGDLNAAQNAAKELLGNAPSQSRWTFVANEVRNGPLDKLGLKRLKVALLSSFAIEFIQSALTARGFLDGFLIETYLGPFNAFRQQILDPDSGLYRYSPDVTVLAVEGRDWIPSFFGQFSSIPEGAHLAALESFRTELDTLAGVFHQRCSSTLLVHNLALPMWVEQGIADHRTSQGQVRSVLAANEIIREVCLSHPGSYLVDYLHLVFLVGASRWYDIRMDHYARSPIAADQLATLADEYLKYFRGLAGKTRKCLVLDLDNTLWGGILGEDGIHGIQLSPQYPGSAYITFQETCLQLRARGVILAVASKNNPADVDEVLQSHRHMVLRKEHFAVMKVGWKPKSESLVEISRDLSIGLEHIVVADDNPVECAEVSNAFPMVTTIPLTGSPEHFPRLLLSRGLFDSLGISAEDRARGQLYAQRQKAESLRGAGTSLEDFCRSLNQEVDLAPVSDSSLQRAAQLTQKTNQFNVTTIRYTEADLRARLSNEGWVLTAVSVRDRFGDNGIVGLVMAFEDGSSLSVETFLLSCRVIGRAVESVMLAHVCECASLRSLRFVKGRVIPTAKNVPARDVFHKHGFVLIRESSSGETEWTMDFAASTVEYPPWIKVTGRPNRVTPHLGS